MILAMKESDVPKSLGEKIAEYLARPPVPVLRFYGEFSSERAPQGRRVMFSVRNGLPLPLLYGIYISARHNSLSDYLEKRDHIGPWSTDRWSATLDIPTPAQVEIRVGLIPFEILTDRTEIALR